MTPGRIAYGLAVVSVLCVLSVFFFHAMQGPYSVVHGPVTALLSVRAAAGLRAAIVHSGLNVSQFFIRFTFALTTCVLASLAEFTVSSLFSECSSILRC